LNGGLNSHPLGGETEIQRMQDMTAGFRTVDESGPVPAESQTQTLNPPGERVHLFKNVSLTAIEAGSIPAAISEPGTDVNVPLEPML
jgi:hypothetical protein